MELSDILDFFSSGDDGIYERLEKTTKAVNKYSEHKKLTQKIASTYYLTNLINKDDIAFKMLSCGSKVLMAREISTGRMEIAEGYFCQQRLCALCAFRRSLKKFMNISEIISQDEYKNMEWVFITLTVKNCKADELKLTIQRILSAFRHMTSNKKTVFRKSFKGWFRSLEVTYNDETNEYHPHLHILACVEKKYFHSDEYFKTEEIVQLWKKFLNKAEVEIVDEKEIDVLRGGHRNQLTKMILKKKKTSKQFFEPIEYDPICYIEKVYAQKEKQIAEVAKYTVKPVDYSDKPEVLETLTKSLERVRCTAYGGIMKKTFQRLKLTDTEEEIDKEKKETRLQKFLQDPNYSLYLLSWNGGAKTYDLCRYDKPTGVFQFSDEYI